VQLTNLRKPFWRMPLITKGDLLQYYADVAAPLVRICATAQWS
jgi:DNA primase